MTDFQNCKKYFICWCTTLTINGDRLFMILYKSVANTCKFLWWILTELSFTRSSWKVESKSSYVILRARSCSVLGLGSLKIVHVDFVKHIFRNLDLYNQKYQKNYRELFNYIFFLLGCLFICLVMSLFIWLFIRVDFN